MSDKNNKGKEKHVTLKVAEARQRDVGRSIIRIDPETMKNLGMKTGDIVEIIGKKNTAAISWPAYPQDQALGITRIDGRIRKNASVSLGEDVKIVKAKKISAKSVSLAPTNTKLRSDSRFESFVKRKMLNLPVTKGDVIFILLDFSREISFMVVDTIPAGPSKTAETVIIRINTELHISENPDKEEATNGIPIITYEEIEALKDDLSTRDMAEKREKRINIRASESEIDDWKEEALKRQMTFSNFIRYAVQKHIISDVSKSGPIPSSEALERKIDKLTEAVKNQKKETQALSQIVGRFKEILDMNIDEEGESINPQEIANKIIDILEKNKDGKPVSEIRLELGVKPRAFNDAMQILDDSGKVSINVEDYKLVIKPVDKGDNK
ncbi:MAG: hypothetical protein ACFFCS_15050 [Candidatus Hodarchaeota archaeon]